MTREEQDKILSAMGGYRRTGTKGEKGIGFGLMLSQDFIRENGGRFWVRSEKDKGSTFSFTLSKAS
jgi:signal transduction histidine kinase